MPEEFWVLVRAGLRSGEDETMALWGPSRVQLLPRLQVSQM